MNRALQILAESQASTNSQYLNNHGRYRLKVRRLKFVDGTNGLSAILEGKVVKAETVKLPHLTAQFGELAAQVTEPYPLGSVVSYCENLNVKTKGGGSRYKTALMAVTGESEIEMTPVRMAQLVDYYNKDSPQLNTDNGQPTFGLYVDVDVMPTVLDANPKKGQVERIGRKEFWRAVPETDQPSLEQLEAERKVDGLKPLVEIIAAQQAAQAAQQSQPA